MKKLSVDALLILRFYLLSDDPRCGAEAMRECEVKRNTTYLLIKNLAASGLIKKVATLPSPIFFGPDATFYRITAKGHEVYLTALLRFIIPDHLWKLETEKEPQP